MQIYNNEGYGFQLKVLGYQLSKRVNDYYDDNWLIIKVQVKHPKGEWIAKDPCLLTFELQDMIDWLNTLKNTSEPPKGELSFMESELKFRLIEHEQGKLLLICFNYNLRPEWASREDDFCIDFALEKLNLDSLIKPLVSYLKKYPVRQTLP